MRAEPTSLWSIAWNAARLSACVFLCLSAGLARAEEAAPKSLDPWVNIHGFVSQGYIKSTDNNYLARSRKGSFEFTEVGLNVTTEPTHRLRIGVQLFARNVGTIGNFSVQFDWFYLDYRFFDWLGIRAGRTKLPFGLYNEINDIDMARTAVLLPQSIYPIQNRSYLLAQIGVEIYGLIPLGPAGDLEYRGYGGTLSYNPSYEGTDENIRKVTAPYVAGGRLMWKTPLQGLQLGASAQWLELDIDYALAPATISAVEAAGIMFPDGFDGNLNVKLPVALWVASIEYIRASWLLAAEYSQWTGRYESSIDNIFPTGKITNERFYGLISYRIISWLTVGTYYSALFEDIKHRKVDGTYQHDLAGTLRFDINDFWLVKLEAHYMRGTALLASQLNGGKPRADLDPSWWAFFVKTTAYF